MVRGVEQVRTVARLPLEVGKLGVRAARWSGGRLVVQTALQLLGTGRELGLGREHIAQRLEATQPLSEARLGAEDVRRGLREHDPELTGIGQRKVIQNVASAERNPKVPDAVTGKVVGIKRGLPGDALQSPLVSPELAAEARGVINKFGEPQPDGARPPGES